MNAQAVRTLAELIAADGRPVVAYGRYEARPRPTRGGQPARPADRAVVVLHDDVAVWLEPLDAAGSVRSERERKGLDGRPVQARGIAHERMPLVGQGPLAPCLQHVRDLKAVSA